MKLTHFFIDHPIFASVISVFITIVGAVAYFSLPVAQYPEIAPPTIQISASYPGASAEVVSATVSTPLEQQINGVQDMLYMNSQATGDGKLTITVTFKLGTNLDTAQVLTQNRIATAIPRLPDQVQRLGVTVKKASPDLMMVVHLYSPGDTRDQLYLSNYATLQVKDVLARLSGVGDINIVGVRDYAMRVWLDPEKVAARGMTAGEVVSAMQAENVQVSSGVLNQPPVQSPGAFQLSVETLGRLSTPEQFRDIVIRTDPSGRITRVRDIARVELAAQDYTANGYLDTRVAVPMLIFQQPGSNALDTAQRVRSTMATLARDFPAGVAYDIVYDPTQFISQSVDAVIETIFEAVLLVILVVVLFLPNVARLRNPHRRHPHLTRRHLRRAGRLRLLAQQLVPVRPGAGRGHRCGRRNRRGGERGAQPAAGTVASRGRAPHDGRGVWRAGRHRADTLRCVHTGSVHLWHRRAVLPAVRHNDRGFDGAVLRRVADAQPGAMCSPVQAARARHRRPTRPLNIGAAGLRLLQRLQSRVRLAFRPLRPVDGAAGTVRRRHAGAVRRPGRAGRGPVCPRAHGIHHQPGPRLLAEHRPASARLVARANGRRGAGSDQDRAGYARRLPHGAIRWLRRCDGHQRLVRRHRVRGPQAVRGAGQGWADLRYDHRRPAPPPVRRQRPRRSSPWHLRPCAASAPQAASRCWCRTSRAVAPRRWKPRCRIWSGPPTRPLGLVGVFTLFNTRTPKVFADIDRTRAQILGVPITRVFEAMQVYLGSAYVNDFNILGRTYQVVAQADEPFRRDTHDIAQLKTRNSAGRMVPIGSVAQFRDITGPYRVPRYNLYPAAEVQGATLPGYSSSYGIAAMEKLATERLPDGFSFEWTDLAYQQKLAGNTILLIFGASALFVFLVLAAQYESWTLPLAIVLIVPMCLLAAVTGLLIRGMNIDILAQDRLRGAGWAGSEERHPDRGVRKAVRGRRRHPAGGRHRRCPNPAAANPDDVAGVHLRRDSPGGRDRRRVRDAAGAGHRYVLWDAWSDGVRPAVHAHVLCRRAPHLPAARASRRARARWGAGDWRPSRPGGVAHGQSAAPVERNMKDAPTAIIRRPLSLSNVIILPK